MSTLPVGRRIVGRLRRYIPGLLTCGEFENFILDYFEGELSKTRQRLFRFHLATCAECRTYLTAYEKAVALGKRAFDDADAPVPEDIPEDLIIAILDTLSSD